MDEEYRLTNEALKREREYLYWLCQIPSLGAVSIRKLGEYFGSYEAVYYNIEETHFHLGEFLKKRQLAEVLEWKKKFKEIKKGFMELERRDIRFVTPLDEDYPQRLKNIYDYPMGLYVRGKLPQQQRPAVAIVGARGCSSYGEQLSREFARVLATENVQIISGMALGIDGAAHEGALKAGGMTCGVLGCGVNICYPSSNYRIYEAMRKAGGILSEFPLDTAPRPFHFPMRNRIISGLADAVLVVEAKEKSGSLITAELGLEQGREIFAVPGRITDNLSGGCNRLIQQGAHMAASPGDILEYLGVKYQKELILQEKNVNGLAKKEKMVYSCLDFKSKHVEEIISETGIGVSECMGILLELELGGYVYRSANHYYAKKL